MLWYYSTLNFSFNTIHSDNLFKLLLTLTNFNTYNFNLFFVIYAKDYIRKILTKKCYMTFYDLMSSLSNVTYVNSFTAFDNDQ